MDKEINQLVEMGATLLQARVALRRYKDVMQAAERIFDGEFADVADDDEDVRMAAVSTPGPMSPSSTPLTSTSEHEDVNEDVDMQDDDDDGVDDYVDYDSDYETKRTTGEVDPYAGIFFSKDRREEVIEVEEESESAVLPGLKEPLKLMMQGDWMKGCPEGNESNYKVVSTRTQKKKKTTKYKS